MACRGMKNSGDRGFTLMEVLIVVVVLGILSTIALRTVQNGIESSRVTATQDEMLGLAHAIAGNPDLYANGLRSDFGYVGDLGAVPCSLDDLITNPGAYGTWNGPYITGRFTEDADGYKKDAWGNTYSFSGGITISSTGGGSTPLTTAVASVASDLTNNTVSGTITDAAGNPPGDSSVAISVTVTYPDGSGGTTTASTNPASGGSFTFSSIPVGIQSIDAVYRATDDTVTAFAAVLPRTGAMLSLRLPGIPFAGSGGGGSPGSIDYVPGSAETNWPQGDDVDVEFEITNPGTSAVTVTWLSASYSATGYFQSIRWGGSTVFNESSPRAGSDDTCPFTSAQTISGGATITIELNNFDTLPSGGPAADVSNTDFTITFSDGSVINFNSGS